MTHAIQAPEGGHRADFELYFAESRKSKGAGKRPTFEVFPDGTYKDDHTQRHWWTWQQALQCLVSDGPRAPVYHLSVDEQEAMRRSLRASVKIVGEEIPQCAAPKAALDYQQANPLGGPAKVFRAMADAIEAGDSYEDTLRRYRYAEAKPSPAEGDVARERALSVAAKLRAMATNYPAGHLWDKLDAKACIEAALLLDGTHPKLKSGTGAGGDLVDRVTTLRDKSCRDGRQFAVETLDQVLAVLAALPNVQPKGTEQILPGTMQRIQDAADVLSRLLAGIKVDTKEHERALSRLRAVQAAYWTGSQAPAPAPEGEPVAPSLIELAEALESERNPRPTHYINRAASALRILAAPVQADDYFEEQAIRDLARVFGDNSYSIGGAWEWSKYRPEQIVAFAKALMSRPGVQAPAVPHGKGERA